MNTLDRKLGRDLIKMWGQAIAIVTIVACGIAVLVSMLSAYDSLNLSQTTYYDRYRFADVFVQLERAPEAIASRIQEIPGVKAVQTRVVVDVTLDVPGLDEPATGRLISIPERRSPILNDLYLSRGRYIQPGRRDEVLVSEAFAEANRLDLGQEIGAVINGRWEELRIVGIALSPEYIYEIRGTDLLPDNKRFGVMWMAREALGKAFDMDGAFNDVSLSLMPGASEAEVIFRLDRLLERYGGLGAYGRDDQVSHFFLSGEITGLQATAVVMPAVFLGIAAFLLNLLLARLVSTQREQIAVLKAFGYGNLAVGLHYLKLVSAIVLLGAAVGMAIGLWLGSAMTQFYTNFYRFPLLRYEAGVGLITTSIAVSGSAAIIGAFTAVQQVVSLPPAEAMRSEAPAQFRPTFIERLGLQRLLSPAGRIVLRNLERRPLQAFFSMLGIAMAAAILIVGFFFGDAINHVVEIQFRQVQREDITLTFNEPLSARARYELERLPGVMRSEPFRSVGARLRFEHRTHRSAITGLQPDSELHRLVDRDSNAVSLPANGVVLSTKLAEILGVSVGDTLTVEVLEADRPVRRVPVVGTVDELLGLSAYMDIDALNALMREGQTISGAYLIVDSDRTDELYSLLKKTPAVAGVALRQTLIDQFYETIASSFGVFAGVLVVFACAIACGVVYNATRIALSERSRELATLRIIGFTQDEIAFILLGEQALITAIAIPCGFVLGYWFAAGLTMTSTYNSELFRLPLFISRSTYIFSVLVVAIAAIVSGWIIRKQLDRLDLIAVLKTRE